MRYRIAACAIAVAALAAPAAAHHSAGLVYAMDQQVTMEGVVTRFNLGNPHMRIFFTHTAEDGTEAEWMAEGGSRTVLLRRGWTADTLKAGDHVVLVGNPSRDGSNVFHVNLITMPDGTQVGAEDFDAATFDPTRPRRPVTEEPSE